MDRKEIIKILDDVIRKLPDTPEALLTKSMLCSVMASLEGEFALEMARAMLDFSESILSTTEKPTLQ